MIKTITLILTAFLFNSILLFSQYEFYSSYNNYGYTKDIVSAINGDIIAIAADGLVFEGYLFRTGCKGNVKWSVKLAHDNYLNLNKISEALNENIYVLGTIMLPGGYSNILVLQYSKTGQLNWSKRYYYQSTNVAWDLKATPDNGFVIVGGGCSGNNFVMRGDSSGNLLWQKQYINPPFSGTAISVELLDNFKFVIYGLGTQTTGIGYNLFQVDSSGALDWFRHYDGTSQEFSSDLLVTNDGNFAMLGQTKRIDDSLGDIVLNYANSEGNLLWTKVYDFPNNAGANSIVETASGNFLIAGTYYHSSALHNEGLLMSVSKSGVLNWAKTTSNHTLPGIISDEIKSMKLYNDNSVIYGGDLGGISLGRLSLNGYFCNQSFLQLSVVNDFHSTSVPSIYVNSLHFSVNDEAVETVYNLLQEIEICGYVADNLDCAQSHTSVIETDNSFEINISPNPSDGTFYIQNSSNQNTDYQIFNSLGEQILKGNGYSIDLSNYTSGVYFAYLNKRKVMRIIKL